MKDRNSRPSCIDLDRASVPPAGAPGLFSGPAVIRRGGGTMRTSAHLVGVGFRAWNLRGLCILLKNLLEGVGSDCRPAVMPRATTRRRWRANFAPGRVAAGTTAMLRREKQGLNVAFNDRGGSGGLAAGRHLLIALWSAEHRRGVYWETAGFLAIWLSGLIGIAICLF